MNKDLLNIDGFSKKNQKETLTPYKIAVVTLIKEYCNDNEKGVNEKKDFCYVSLKLIQSPDMDFGSLLNLLYPSEYQLHRFALRLNTELNSLCEKGVEGLLVLMESLAKLMKPSSDHSLSPPLLSKNSVLGLYIRRIIVFFEKLSFHQVVLLFESLKSYIANPVTKAKVLAENESGLSIDDESPTLNVKGMRKIWGGRQAELLVAQQAYALQIDEHKALPPSELWSLVKELLRCSPYYAEAHYLNYLNCLRVNDYCGAIDSLYHCFDRLTPLENRTASDDRCRTFRYAALNLAVLHAHFNHKEVALAALKEAIMMAQEAGDNVCLQLAHAWMYHLTNKQKKGPLIERSVGKASMLGITHTTSLGLIASAHNSALEARSPPQIFETLIKSDFLNCQHSMIDLMSITNSERSALWSYYGKLEMSSVCSQLLLLHNSGDKKQHIFNGPSTCQAVVNIANILLEFGEYELVNVVLGHAKDRFPNEPCNKIWMLSEQLCQFTRLMRHGDYSQSEAIAIQISSLDSLESLFCKAQVYLAKGNFPKGLELLKVIENSENINSLHRVRAMVLQNEIICSSMLSINGNLGSDSLVLLNSALEIAKSNYLSYYAALVKMHLANVQLNMKMPSQALKIMDESILHVLAHGGFYDQGRALVLYGKCLVATAPESSSDIRKLVIQDAIKALNKAVILFTKIEAYSRIKSTLLLLCELSNEIDSKTSRNEYAYNFSKIDTLYPTRGNNIALF